MDLCYHREKRSVDKVAQLRRKIVASEGSCIKYCDIKLDIYFISIVLKYFLLRHCHHRDNNNIHINRWYSSYFDHSKILLSELKKQTTWNLQYIKLVAESSDCECKSDNEIPRFVLALPTASRCNKGNLLSFHLVFVRATLIPTKMHVRWLQSRC